MANQGKGISQSQDRLNRINEIWRLVKDQQIGYSKKKLIADVCLKYGTRKRTAQEYVGILIDAGKIQESNGKLF